MPREFNARRFIRCGHTRRALSTTGLTSHKTPKNSLAMRIRPFRSRALERSFIGENVERPLSHVFPICSKKLS
jgi:hypothetical protein